MLSAQGHRSLGSDGSDGSDGSEGENVWLTPGPKIDLHVFNICCLFNIDLLNRLCLTA